MKSLELHYPMIQFLIIWIIFFLRDFVSKQQLSLTNCRIYFSFELHLCLIATFGSAQKVRRMSRPSIPWAKTAIIHNYSPKWRWIVVDIYRAAAARLISTTFTDTGVNNCFSIYHTSWIKPKVQLYLWQYTDESHFVFRRLLGGE